MSWRHLIVSVGFMMIAATANCSGKDDVDTPEEALLATFEKERDTLVTYQDRPYHEYLAHQYQGLKQKLAATVPVIVAINKKFGAMPAHEKLGYELEWQRKFQPVIDEIALWTKKMASREAADLTPEIRARIESLTLKTKMAEKKAPGIKLLPVFFHDP